MNKQVKQSQPVAMFSTGVSSLVKGYLKAENASFINVISQMAEGKELTVANTTISLKENSIGATLLLSKFLDDTKAVNNVILKIYNFEKELQDQVSSAVTS